MTPTITTLALLISHLLTATLVYWWCRPKTLEVKLAIKQENGQWQTASAKTETTATPGTVHSPSKTAELRALESEL